MPESLHHISTRFDEDIAQLRSHVLQMGGLVESQIAMSIEAYGSFDHALLDAVIENDQKINALEKKIDDASAHLIAKRQPAASDLRLVFGITKIVTDLERMGDESKRIAQLLKKNEGGALIKAINLRHMMGMQLAMVRAAMDAFARMDAILARKIIVDDDAIDAEFKSLVRQLITHMMEEARHISFAIDIIWMARAIERIGDHAKNVAEQVVFIVEGQDIRHLAAQELAS